MSVVLDASAILALLFDEPGSDLVADHAQGAQLLSVNFAEVLSRIADKGGDPAAAAALIDRLEIEHVPFDSALALLCANLREPTRHIGASLGDRACLALASTLAVPALTADRRWSELDIGVEIVVIR